MATAFQLNPPKRASDKGEPVHAMQNTLDQKIEMFIENNKVGIATLTKQLANGISLLGKKVGDVITVQILPPVGSPTKIGYRVQDGKPYGLANAIAVQTAKDGEHDIRKANYLLVDKPFQKVDKSEEQVFFYSHL